MDVTRQGQLEPVISYKYIFGSHSISYLGPSVSGLVDACIVRTRFPLLSDYQPINTNEKHV